MEMFIAVSLIIAGLTVGFLGLKLFKIMLPLAGLLVGAIVGFTGIQGIFGTGVTSTTIAVLVACVFGLVLALLSYAFFDIALIVMVGLGLSSLFTIFFMIANNKPCSTGFLAAAYLQNQGLGHLRRPRKIRTRGTIAHRWAALRDLSTIFAPQKVEGARPGRARQ